MKLDQIDQEKSKGMSVQVAVLLASVLILLLLVVMLVLNRDRLTAVSYTHLTLPTKA